MIIIKNISSSVFNSSDNDVSIRIPTGSQETIPSSEFPIWYESVNGGDAETEITNGNLVVNDGNVDLIATKGINLLRRETHFLKSSASDKSPDYLINKLHAGTNITIEEYDAGSGNKKAKLSTGSGYFGAEHNYAESESLSSTTSTNYQNKVSLSVDVPAGKYHIGWSYEWRTGRQGDVIKVRVQLDDTTDLFRVETSPNGDREIHPAAGFKSNVDLDGSHTIDLDYASYNSNKTVYIGRARLELWRVS